jgi:hypothetical protein
LSQFAELAKIPARGKIRRFLLPPRALAPKAADNRVTLPNINNLIGGMLWIF